MLFWVETWHEREQCLRLAKTEGDSPARRTRVSPHQRQVSASMIRDMSATSSSLGWSSVSLFRVRSLDPAVVDGLLPFLRIDEGAVIEDTLVVADPV